MPETIREYRLEQTITHLEECIRKIAGEGRVFRGGCSNLDCICWRPHAICEEFMGDDLNDHKVATCARCGWDWNTHQREEN